jgi:hypothetical protein
MAGGGGHLDMNGAPGPAAESEAEDARREAEEADCAFSAEDLEKCVRRCSLFKGLCRRRMLHCMRPSSRTYSEKALSCFSAAGCCEARCAPIVRAAVGNCADPAVPTFTRLLGSA